MPFQSQRAPLKLSMEMREELSALAQSRAAPRSHSERARMLLAYADGTTVSAIARMLKTNRLKVERCLNKAVQFGPRAALDDLAGRGRPATITAEARTWVVALACQKPKDLGYPEELWTSRRLAAHTRRHGPGAGHKELAAVGRGPCSRFSEFAASRRPWTM